MFNKKNVLITGGTGSFGKTFIEILLKKYNPKKVIIYSRDEQKQFQLQKKWTGKKFSSLRYLIGDVRDLDRLMLAMEDVDIVVHAAALKHVDIAEYNPFEVIKTNILGAENLIRACLNNKVKKVIALSTDKASSPINLYGATKLTSDKLFISANYYKGNKDIKFSIVRYGNVMGSRGSIIPLFLNRKSTGVLPITDKRMTRFNISLEEAADFVLLCFKKMWGGEIFVPKMPSFKIIDVARAVSPKSKFKFVGIRPGEKIHEELISRDDAINTLEYKNYFVITPNYKLIGWDKRKYLKLNRPGKNCGVDFSYNSEVNQNVLTVIKIKKLVQKFLDEKDKNSIDD